MAFLAPSGELELSRAMVTCFPGPGALRLGRGDAAGAGGLALDVRLLRVRRLRRVDIMKAVFKELRICLFHYTASSLQRIREV